MNTSEIRERLAGAGDPKQAPISVVELTELLDIVESAFTPAPLTESPIGYSIVFTQLIAPEYGDGEDYWYVQKEFRLPFIPSYERVGFILPDLGPYVIFINWSHYDLGEQKFYVTIQADWVQVWKNDSEYDHTATQMKLENRLEELQAKGWTLRKKPKEEY